MRSRLINNGKAMIIRMFIGLSRIITASRIPQIIRRRLEGDSLNFKLNHRNAFIVKKEKVCDMAGCPIA